RLWPLRSSRTTPSRCESAQSEQSEQKSEHQNPLPMGVSGVCSDFPTFFRETPCVYGKYFFVGGRAEYFSRAHIEILILSRNSRNKYIKAASHGRFRVPTRVPTVPTQGHLFRLIAPADPHALPRPPPGQVSAPLPWRWQSRTACGF